MSDEIHPAAILLADLLQKLQLQIHEDARTTAAAMEKAAGVPLTSTFFVWATSTPQPDGPPKVSCGFYTSVSNRDGDVVYSGPRDWMTDAIKTLPKTEREKIARQLLDFEVEPIVRSAEGSDAEQ
jgi:hypothetical protein